MTRRWRSRKSRGWWCRHEHRDDGHPLPVADRGGRGADLPREASPGAGDGDRPWAARAACGFLPVLRGEAARRDAAAQLSGGRMKRRGFIRLLTGAPLAAGAAVFVKDGVAQPASSVPSWRDFVPAPLDLPLVREEALRGAVDANLSETSLEEAVICIVRHCPP